MRKLVATAQAGFEGLSWLRSRERLEGDFLPNVRNGNFNMAALIAVQGLARKLPNINYQRFLERVVDSEHSLIGSGGEAIVTQQGQTVHKYLVGKEIEPDRLLPTVADRLARVDAYLADFIPPTSASIESIKLFKRLPESDYVCLQQPLLNIAINNPHEQEGFFEQNPQAREQMAGLTRGMFELFEDHGLIMDVSNSGNIIWGTLPGEEENRIILLDTLPIHISESTMVGMRVPMWSPMLQFEDMTNLVYEFNPALFDNGSGEIELF